MRYHAPVDSNCPEVRKFTESLHNDPMTAAYGAPVDDIIMEGFETKHRQSCERCRKYGAENIEVREG